MMKLMHMTIGGAKNKMQKTINLTKTEFKRKALLDYYRTKQPFRVSVGKSKWIPYEVFNPAYNMREILKDEIVIEFDTDDKNLAYEAINFTGVDLYKAGITFSVWDHGGRSPHLHIHNLPCGDFEKQKRALFKKVFIRNFVPKEYLHCVDLSLTGIHVLRIEWSPCWKNKYGVKELLHEFNPSKEIRPVMQQNQIGVSNEK